LLRDKGWGGLQKEGDLVDVGVEGIEGDGTS